MKFVCQNCKAKYQIADEKVAGRNLKMKCRKCDAIIPISGAGIGAAHSDSSGPSQQVRPDAPNQVPPRSGSEGRPSVPQGATSTRRSSATPPVGTARSPNPAAGAGAPKKAPARTFQPGRAPLPRPRPTPVTAASAKAAPAPSSSPRSSTIPEPSSERQSASPRTSVQRTGEATRLSLNPTPSSGRWSPSSFEERWSSAPPGSDERDGSRMSTDAPGALAGAFQAAVSVDGQRASSAVISSPVLSEVSRPSLSEPPISSDEWFVGVGGVPTGPLRLSELRAKAMAGQVHADSLVWREGFENWLPLHKFPELVAIVEEGMSSARASLQPLAPPVAPNLAEPPLEPKEPLALEPSTGPLVVTPSTNTTTNVDIDEPVVLGRRSGVSPAALFAMVVAVAFGLTIGFVLFGGEKTKVIREVVEVPVAAQQEAPVKEEPAEEAKVEEETSEPEAPAQPSTSKPSSGTKVVAASKPASAPQEAQGLSGLSGLRNVSGGPQTGPANGPSGSSGQPLDSAQVQSTVSRYTTSVRRSCWQPALDTRDPDAPASARVTVAITVGPDGRVQNASTTSNPKGYPGLASCITQRVRTWTFPPSSGTTTVNVPFVFAAQ